MNFDVTAARPSVGLGLGFLAAAAAAERLSDRI